MKYPQLVSPRAVNAISDWLVSRLEQLGVESPQIYTRLLLSLLQSSVQVNDPIEFSNLEAFFASRKGGHSKRFHLPSDTETLKKLNAVQCLREIVSNEHETSAIELLVNELCEKLTEIEKRCQDFNDEQSFLIDTTSVNIEQLPLNTEAAVAAAATTGKSVNSLATSQHHLCRNAAHILTAHDSTRRLLNTENALKDLDNDPKKRYFRAFPALTKEMEDSFRVWRRNAKSLTWPIVGRSIVADSNSLSTSHSSSASSNLSASAANIKGVEKKLKEDQHLRAVADICGSATLGSEVQAASAKKKTKRRRNQALAKGKTPQTVRKIALGNSCSNPTSGAGKYYQHQHYANHRKTSPSWDTDFKGCWEMGPDLIKEFLSRQKIATKRSRSNSDSMEHLERKECNSAKDSTSSNTEEFYPGNARPTMKRYLNMSFCCDDDDDVDDDRSQRNCNEAVDGVDYVDEDYDDDDALNSMPALMGGNSVGNPRRLYQREGILQKPLVVCSVVNDTQHHNLDVQEDFANFKAKFNSSVEALWKDAEQPQTTIPADEVVNINKPNTNTNTIGISSAFYANTSLNALAPFKHDLWNFWSNYNQQSYDPASTSSMITNCLDDSSASSGAGAGADIANSSDYFSMPSNLDDFDKSVGAVRRLNEAGASLGAHTPSINVFLQNSIWSSSGDCVDGMGIPAAGGESDESFLYKVWHSNKKLSQIEVGNKKDEMIPSMFKDTKIDLNEPQESANDSVGVGNGAKLDFPPYSSLKWSEGINAGPPYNNMRSNNANADSMPIDNLLMSAEHKAYASFGSTATVTGANWDAPVYGQNVQPDLKSWCASNPMSLTEMYGSDVCDSITQESQGETDHQGPAVTLPNHCSTSSGFIAYARIKQSGFMPPPSAPQQSSSANASRLTKDYFRSGEEENLLTSESTHFHPIESFVDGHSFSISSALDVVEFERSSSGFLYYESNEYMEYTRNDLYMADEEVASTNLLSFAASAACQTNECANFETKGKEKAARDMFVIKFRLKRSGEMACQTEEVDFQLAAAKMAEQTMPAEYQDEMPMFYNKNLTAAATQPNNDVIFAAVTKAVAAAAKAAAQRGLESVVSSSSLPWVPVTSTQHRQQQPWLEYSSLCDEVDSSISNVDTEQLNQFWSMQAIEMQCHQRRLPVNTYEARGMAEIDKNDDNSMDSSSHTLWGMCAVCNSCDYGKSMPANRLLRDELNLEADEIMSDLRYMQDLYIGEASEESCSETATIEQNKESALKSSASCQGDEEEENGRDVKSKVETMAVGHVQASMLQKVNQLIEDLLKPEQTGKLMKMTTCESDVEIDDENGDHMHNGVNTTNVWSLSNNVKDSWHYGNDHLLANIWQHESEENIKKNESNAKEFEDSRKNVFMMKPMKLLRQVGGSLNEEDMYMDKRNWEHDNLAKIWQPKEVNATTMSFKKDDDKVESLLEQEATNVESEDLVEKNNLKNLQCITRTTPPPSLASPLSPPSASDVMATATYKRVQQFLNNSANKIKIAANRKRRHSASQNFYHQQQQMNLNNSGNNNNNDHITDLNRYKQKIAATTSNAAAAEQMPVALEPRQTFITCKYWTTTTNGSEASLESAAAAMMLLAAATNSRTDGFIGTSNYEDTNDDEGIMLEENTFGGGNTFSCLIDKNSSILKHVAMMTRPLTR